ncbi:MAG: hypothetical protein V4448_16335, partial [Pseudomonadota bacterium]
QNPFYFNQPASVKLGVIQIAYLILAGVGGSGLLSKYRVSLRCFPFIANIIRKLFSRISTPFRPEPMSNMPLNSL